MTKVLIDDDILIQLGKQLEAEKQGEKLDCYFSIDDFLAVADQYSEDTIIFLNSKLETKRRMKNFKNIILYQKSFK